MALTESQIARHEHLTDARVRANTDPTPGALNLAFNGEPIRVGPLTLQPFVNSHILLLKKLNSPFYRKMVEEQKEAEAQKVVEYEDEEIYEALFVFANPLPQLRGLLAEGREKFREVALRGTADLMIATPDEIASAISENVRRAMATRVALKEPSSGEPGAGFTPPPPTSARSTASAGGSTSLAG